MQERECCAREVVETPQKRVDGPFRALFSSGSPPLTCGPSFGAATRIRMHPSASTSMEGCLTNEGITINLAGSSSLLTGVAHGYCMSVSLDDALFGAGVTSGYRGADAGYSDRINGSSTECSGRNGGIAPNGPSTAVGSDSWDHAIVRGVTREHGE